MSWSMNLGEGGCLAVLCWVCKTVNPVREKEVTVLGLA